MWNVFCREERCKNAKKKTGKWQKKEKEKEKEGGKKEFVFFEDQICVVLFCGWNAGVAIKNTRYFSLVFFSGTQPWPSKLFGFLSTTKTTTVQGIWVYDRCRIG